MDVQVDLAQPADDEPIRDLLRREALPGPVQIAFARDPDFSVGCAVTGDDCQIVVARSANGDVVGVACRSTRRVFLNGEEHRIGYLGQLRVARRFRGRWLVSRGFALLREIDRSDPVLTYLASIVDGNDQATGVLVTHQRRWFPRFREIAAYRTLALPLGGGKESIPGPEAIVAGTRDLLSPLARFLRTEGRRRHLFTVWTEDAVQRLERFGLRLPDVRVALSDGAIVGAAALWDQTAYKQSIVRGYTGWAKLASRLPVSGWPGVPRLPRIGDEIRSAFVALVCVANDDARIFGRLLREIYKVAAARGFHYLLIGLDACDPLLPVARSYRHFTYPSRLYLASYRSNGGSNDAQFDERPAYVDIATL